MSVRPLRLLGACVLLALTCAPSRAQDPWITDAPGAQLGCVYVQENMVFEPGKHYVWRYGKIEALASAGPPPEVIAGFALPEVGIDVSKRDACAL